MKVLLVANYEPDAQNSMLAFRRVLERELPRLGCEVRALAPTPRVQRFGRSYRARKWLGYVDKFILFLPTLVRQARWADVVHVTDHSNAMYVPWIAGRPNVVTCHDVIAVQAAQGKVEGWNVGWSGRLFQRLIVRGLARADLIACVSDLTRRELVALDLADPPRVVVTRNGLNDEFAPPPPAEVRGLLAGLAIDPAAPYLLHVGMDLPRKNRRRVVETFIALRQRAAAGARPAPVERLLFVGPAPDAELQTLAEQHGVADRITALQGLSHAQLRAVYAGATALLFPSLQEGFGWPVIEAQACGCPVFTSDLAPMNEIGGEGAVYVDPKDPLAMAEAIEQAAPRFDQLRRLGLANARHYTPGRMAEAIFAAYGQAAARHGSGR
jgi:glycosyltransferase involved in cell wall biosynthesis